LAIALAACGNSAQSTPASSATNSPVASNARPSAASSSAGPSGSGGTGIVGGAAASAGVGTGMGGTGRVDAGVGNGAGSSSTAADSNTGSAVDTGGGAGSAPLDAGTATGEGATYPEAGPGVAGAGEAIITAGWTTGSDAGDLTYVFSTFWEPAGSTLLIYQAPDALNFTQVGNSGFAGPTDNLRDPSIMKYSDGKYYVAFTTPEGKGCCGTDLSFSIAASADLMTWATYTTIPSGVAGTQTTWAPEWFKDSDGSVNILVSIDPGGGHRTYLFKATDSTLMNWAGPTEMGIGPDFIDTFVVLLGATYHAFTKDSTTSYIEHATASSLTGPWTFVGTGDWAGWGVHREGPSVIQLPGNVWRAFIDGYGSGGHEMYTDSTDNFATWTTPKPIPVIGNTTSHGTVIGVPQL
jgi:hypothetical protein